MKMLRATAKQADRRNQRIESVLDKFPSLAPLSAGDNAYSFVDWTEEDGETQIDIEVRDETIVERLASELKACGTVVKVYAPEQYDRLSEGAE